MSLSDLQFCRMLEENAKKLQADRLVREQEELNKVRYHLYSLRNRSGDIKRCAVLLHEDVVAACNARLAVEYKEVAEPRYRKAFDIEFSEWQDLRRHNMRHGYIVPEMPRIEDYEFFWCMDSDQSRNEMLVPWRDWPEAWKRKRP